MDTASWRSRHTHQQTWSTCCVPVTVPGSREEAQDLSASLATRQGAGTVNSHLRSPSQAPSRLTVFLSFCHLHSPLEGCPLGDKRTKAQRGCPCLNSHKEPAEDLTLIQGWTKSGSGASADSVLAVLTTTACSSIEGEENHSHQRPQKCKWTSGNRGPRKGSSSARIQISIPCPHQPLCPQSPVEGHHSCQGRVW